MGGLQTKGLALRGADGRDYTFRGVDKDPTSILPEELRDTWARGLVQDQIAASSPAAFLVVDELMDAAGILHTKTRLVAMPDDARLGEFRQEFAGIVGQISEYPGGRTAQNPGFQGALEILKHEDFYARLAAGLRPPRRAGVPEGTALRPHDRRLGPAPRPVALGEVRRPGSLAADP